MTSSKARGFAVEDTAGLLLKFASGAIGTVTLSDATPAPWSWELSSGENAAYPKQDQPCYLFAGTKGSLSVPTMELWSYPGEGGWYAPLSRAAVEVPSADPLVEQLRHFLRRHREKRNSADFRRGRHGDACRGRSRARGGAYRRARFPGPDHGEGRMNKRSIATVSLSGSLDEKLRAIAAAGFDAVEIFENDLLSFSGSPRDVGQMCRDLGLAICAFQPFRDFEGMPEPQRARNFARAERKFDLMQELQTDLMLICSNISPASLGGIDRAAADFRELGERAAARGLRVGYEALAWGRHVNDYRDAWEIVRRADHKSIGIILDSFHALAPSFPTMRDSIDPGRQDLSGAAGRRAEARPRRAVLEPAFPLLPGPGRSAGRRRSWKPCWPPAMRARCRWRYSTTSFAPAPRSAPRPTGCAPSSCSRIDVARRCVRRSGDAAAAEGEEPRRRLHRVRRQRRQSQRPCRAVRPARLSQDRRASQQGRRALVAGPYRSRDQLRAGRLCAFALRRARSRRLRHRDRRR